MTLSYTPKDWSLSDSITDTDLDHVEQGIKAVSDAVDGTTWQTSGVAGVAGTTSWTITTQNYRKVSGLVALDLKITRGGGGTTDHGDIPFKVATMPEGYRPSVAQSLSMGATTGAAATEPMVFKVDTDGSIYAISSSVDFTMGGGYLTVGGIFAL